MRGIRRRDLRREDTRGELRESPVLTREDVSSVKK